jgi:N-acetylneuraminic acid mutarotase
MLATSWTDKSGNFWLFGGLGFGDSNAYGHLNDLWEFNPSTKMWTWISGSNAVGAQGVYGVQGTPSATNALASREGAVGWTDGGGNLWLFGGDTLTGDSSGTEVFFNDLWEFSPASKTWTWMSGSSTTNSVGVYGTLGTASASNVPGARDGDAAWIDSSGNFWLFGGNYLNDLWEFNPTNMEWTWVSGSSTAGALGVYGTQGVASVSNVPGWRGGSVSWTDTSGNFWLFGGQGQDPTGTNGGLNDLWKFNVSAKTWTWVSGANTVNAQGIYGTEGTAAASNAPAGRASAVGCIDASGNLWLFGGESFNPAGSDYNDLWRYQP